MTDIARDRDAEAQALHDEEISEDALSIAGRPDKDDPNVEGYDEEQRAEVLEAEQTDPFARDIIHNLMPDERADADLPDEDDI